MTTRPLLPGIVLGQDILDGIDHHDGANCDQQNIAGNLDIAVIRWRYRQANTQFGG